MLTPSELNNLPKQVTTLYEQVECDIIADMSRRIVKTDFATETAQWQLIRLSRMGVTQDEIFKRMSDITGKTQRELIAKFNTAAEDAYNSDKKAYTKEGLHPVPLAENAQLQRIINAGLAKTNKLFQNLTNTTANTATQQFENALDAAYMQITSGAFDYNTAIRNCIKTLAHSGVDAITYPTGHTDKLDVATRRAALTGVSQTACKMQDALADEMGCDLVEVTAHNGARPSHAEWQGKIYSRSGNSTKYPNFVEKTGYGTGAGLGGWNCRHSFFPFFENSSPAYTQKELSEFENREVAYNGETMTEYDASQKQRNMERRIRKTKRELAGYDAGIKETTDESLKEALQSDFDRKSVMLKRQEAVLKDFTHQTGLRRDRAREQVSANFDTKQNKVVAFNKSVSQKAVQSNKAIVIYAKKRYNYNTERENINAYLRDEHTKALIQSDKTNKTVFIGSQGKHIIGHNNYIQGRSYLTISVEEAQELVNKYAGTGIFQRSASNRWNKKELVSTDNIIGIDVNQKTGAKTPTGRFIIHYSKKGVHIVPTLRS